MAKDEQRERRLAAALRENLRKRKMRVRSEAPPLQGEGDRPAQPGGGGVSPSEDNPER